MVCQAWRAVFVAAWLDVVFNRELFGGIADRKKYLVNSEGRKMEELYKMLLSDRDHESKLFWSIFGVMSVINGGLFAFITQKPDHHFVRVAALLGIGLCIIWALGQRRIRGWVRWWETKLEDVELLYFEELNQRRRANSLQALPVHFTLFRNRQCAVHEGISTRTVGIAIPLLFALAWAVILLLPFF